MLIEENHNFLVFPQHLMKKNVKHAEKLKELSLPILPSSHSLIHHTSHASQSKLQTPVRLGSFPWSMQNVKTSGESLAIQAYTLPSINNT